MTNDDLNLVFTVWAAEGARVAMVTCSQCGAALLIDPRSNLDVMSLHMQWHLPSSASAGTRTDDPG